ncbi:MAG: hypothetical protein A3E01_15305 [Gammaproteobacteria bacterium RIFCSPHIGHO2_12_FULL_63_22]|nr:MAG: hypothetical protein A3E01_15305 [Gammaproteobacteria bacterium RIFCSPHIGHO2_12_FULL_63_22]
MSVIWEQWTDVGNILVFLMIITAVHALFMGREPWLPVSLGALGLFCWAMSDLLRALARLCSRERDAAPD